MELRAEPQDIPEQPEFKLQTKYSLRRGISLGSKEKDKSSMVHDKKKASGPNKRSLK